jgi:uncharacterized membrane protein YbhN (UPF0104 family)
MTDAEPSKDRKPRKSAWTTAILMAVGLALLAWSVAKNEDAIRACLAGRPSISLMLAAFGLYSLGMSAAFYRWFGLVRMIGVPIPIADSLRLSFVGSLFNLVIPGAVGGDLVKVAYLARMDVPKTRVFSSMVIDRLIGLLGLFLLAAAAGLSAWSSSDPPVRRLTLFVLVMITALISVLALIFSGLLGRHSERTRELQAMSAAYRGHLPGVAFWVLVSMVIHALNTGAFYLMSRAILPELTIGPWPHFQIVPLVLFSTAAPIPLGAIGFSENVSGYLFRNVGHPNGAVAMMGFRILQYAFAAIAAVVYAANWRSMRDLVDRKWDGSAPKPADSPS